MLNVADAVSQFIIGAFLFPKKRAGIDDVNHISIGNKAVGIFIYNLITACGPGNRVGEDERDTFHIILVLVGEWFLLV